MRLCVSECRLPPTFQTWFTVTNLHVWLLTVRFRALPPPYGDNFVQGSLSEKGILDSTLFLHGI